MCPTGLPKYETILLAFVKVKLKPKVTAYCLALLSQHATSAFQISARHRAMPIVFCVVSFTYYKQMPEKFLELGYDCFALYSFHTDVHSSSYRRKI
jgi:hypothetical protein